MTAMQWGTFVLAAGGCWSHVMLVVGMAMGAPDDDLHKYAAGTLLCLVGGVMLAAGAGGWPDGTWGVVLASHVLGVVSAFGVFRTKRPAPSSS